MKRLLPIFLMALLVGACGSATPSESPSITPSESPVAEVTPSPSALPSETPGAAPGFTGIALTTPLNLTSGLRDMQFSGRLTPEIAADSERIYFVASTSAPLTKGKHRGASKYGTYRVFAYDPATNTLSYLESVVDPSSLYPAVIRDGSGDYATTSAASGFCADGSGDYRNYDSNETDYFYSAGVLTAYLVIEDGEYASDFDYEAPLDCEPRWAGYESGPRDDLYKKGHPAAVCPPDAPGCDLGDRQSKSSLFAMTYGPYDQANSGRAAGPIVIYANGLAGGTEIELAPDPDELRYYDQATKVTGSILLDGAPLSGWATDAYLLGGQYYLLVQPYEGVDFDWMVSGNSRIWLEGPWQLVRIDPANPGVAIPVTTLH